MIYFADLHIHSKYSRATSPDCNLVSLARWAAIKGIRLLATGDFTHPAWLREIREHLVEAEDGLYRLKEDSAPQEDPPCGGFGAGEVRFLLNVEISSIYKRGGATRKVHNLIHMPDLDAVERFNAKLARIGNIASDGRPILGLDSRDLLEIALDASPDSFLIPAHIWTPWFSLLGSRSGFDSVEECFGDLTSHIFALETGLSSDPAMNRRLSALDRFTMVSNSDLHSPSRLGREVNIFLGRPGYRAVRDALAGGWNGYESGSDPASGLGSMDYRPTGEVREGFVGTIEYFPEEGKYHGDGHRKCSVRLDPTHTEALGGTCPVCGSPVTVGVLNRVNELADREPGERPPGVGPFWRLLPLVEIVAQALDVGPQSKKVESLYFELIRKLGPELPILWSLPLERIAAGAPDIIVEGIRRARTGELHIQAGYDGEYGTVELFAAGEREQLAGQQSLLPVGRVRRRRESPGAGGAPTGRSRRKTSDSPPQEAEAPALNEEQEQAVMLLGCPVLVHAGPGTGKTRTLTHRIARLVETGTCRPEAVTAVTFTRKAAAEVRDRLNRLVPQATAEACWVGTLHQLGMRILEICEEDGLCDDRGRRLLDETESLHLFRDAVKTCDLDLTPAAASSLCGQVSLFKQNLVPPDDESLSAETSAVFRAYEQRLHAERLLDLDDLIVHPVELLRTNRGQAQRIREQIAEHLLVDEFQDVNRAQYALVRLLSGPEGAGLFVIGDPDQAIYGFRGADRTFFLRFRDDYPSARVIRCYRNYRSQPMVLRAALHMLDRPEDALITMYDKGTPVKRVTLPGPDTEGSFIVRTIEALMGGHSFHGLDTGRSSGKVSELGFRDFAVLFRLNAVGDSVEEAFRSSGVPFQRARKATPQDEAEALDPRAESVSLMTVHASKGLEFPVVFVVGCEDGIMPYLGPDGSEAGAPDLEEERRLLYVAMTRAGQELYLTRSVRRTLFGRQVQHPESRFLREADPRLFQFLEPLGKSRRVGGPVPKQGELFG